MSLRVTSTSGFLSALGQAPGAESEVGALPGCPCPASVCDAVLPVGTEVHCFDSCWIGHFATLVLRRSPESAESRSASALLSLAPLASPESAR